MNNAPRPARFGEVDAMHGDNRMTSAEPKMGRPSLYTPELGAAICARIADGESLRRICMDEGMPGMSSVFRWLPIHTEFRENYEKARQQRIDAMAEDILAIADDGQNDTYVDEDGNERTNHDVIARSRLRVDSRKWLLSKMDPKRFGDRVSAEVSGADGGAIKVEEVGAGDVARRIAFLLAQGVQQVKGENP